MCVLICLLAHKSVLLSLFVHASVHSSVFQWICLVQQSHQSIYLSICRWMSCPIESSIHLSVHMPTESSVHLSVHIPVDVLSHGVINPSVCPYACGSLVLWSHQSLCLFMCLWICLVQRSHQSICLFIWLWICLMVCLLVHCWV